MRIIPKSSFAVAGCRETGRAGSCSAPGERIALEARLLPYGRGPLFCSRATAITGSSSPGVRDVSIRDNVFENCNYGSLGWGNACIAVGSGIPERRQSRYHRNIRIENNVFRGFDPRIVNLYCVDGFVFTDDNRIEHTDDYPLCARGNPPFCDGIATASNCLKSGPLTR